MAASAITAPKSRGQLFLQGKQCSSKPSSSTTTTPSPASRARCAPGAKKRRKAIWFRDADVAEAINTALFVGLAGTAATRHGCNHGTREARPLSREPSTDCRSSL